MINISIEGRGEFKWPGDAAETLALWRRCEEVASAIEREPGELALISTNDLVEKGVSSDVVVARNQAAWVVYSVIANMADILKLKGAEEPMATAFHVAESQTTMAEITAQPDGKIRVELSWRPLLNN